MVLADEMGLGKTIQTISFLAYLYFEKQVPGPFLIVGPMSTLVNWQREIKKWFPSANAIIYKGNSISRHVIKHVELCHDVPYFIL